jgi:hypothetical protein
MTTVFLKLGDQGTQPYKTQRNPNCPSLAGNSSPVIQASLKSHQSRIPDRAMTKFQSEALSDVTLLHRKDPCGMEF